MKEKERGDMLFDSTVHLLDDVKTHGNDVL